MVHSFIGGGKNGGKTSLEQGKKAKWCRKKLNGSQKKILLQKKSKIMQKLFSASSKKFLRQNEN